MGIIPHCKGDYSPLQRGLFPTLVGLFPHKEKISGEK